MPKPLWSRRLANDKRTNKTLPGNPRLPNREEQAKEKKKKEEEEEKDEEEKRKKKKKDRNRSRDLRFQDVLDLSYLERVKKKKKDQSAYSARCHPTRKHRRR